MVTTIIYRDVVSEVAGAKPEGEDLWLPLSDLYNSTGWDIRDEGACMGELCVPIPSGQEGEFAKEDGQLFNLTALHRLMGQPAVHDQAHGVWLFGETSPVVTDSLFVHDAPDFSLPDLNGQIHSLSDYRGKKVLLVSWASW